MKEMPKRVAVSIIVPVFNTEEYLDCCLSSLVNQDFKEQFEVIAIDDGSNDNSFEILKRWEETYPGIIRVFHKANGGQSSARNVGLQNMNGEYVAFVDSDDFVETCFLSILYESSLKNMSDISMCLCNRCRGNGGVGPVFDSGFSRSFVSEDIPWVIKNTSFSPCNKLYKAHLWQGVLFPEGITYEDFATIPRVIFKACHISYTHTVLYHYRVNPTSTIQSKGNTTNLDILEAQTILENSELKQYPDLLENLFIRRVLLSMCYSLVQHREYPTLLKSVVLRAKDSYPLISNNEMISRLQFQKRLFLRLLLREKYNLVSLYVFLIEKARICAKRVIPKSWYQ